MPVYNLYQTDMYQKHVQIPTSSGRHSTCTAFFKAELIALGAAAAWGAPVESAAGTLSARQAAAALGQSRLGPRGGQEGRGRRNLRRCAGVRGRARPEGTECDDKVTG
ncbi:hypothetical protein NN561_010747 [Cricetulus griseus]